MKKSVAMLTAFFTVALSVTSLAYTIDNLLGVNELDLKLLDAKKQGTVHIDRILELVRSGAMIRNHDYEIVNVTVLVDEIGEHRQPVSFVKAERSIEPDAEQKYQKFHDFVVKIRSIRSSYRGFFLATSSMVFFNSMWAASFSGVPLDINIAGGFAVSACIVLFDFAPGSLEYIDRKINPYIQYVLIPVLLTEGKLLLKAHLKIEMDYLTKHMLASGEDHHV